MPELNRSYIKNLATDETVYGRGLRYYKEKAIKSISKSSKSEHYHAIIQGKSEYQVDVDLSDAEKIKYSCNCPGSFKYAGACKHTVAVLLFICDYQDKNKATGDLPPAKRHIAQVLDYFEGMDNTPTKGDRFKMEVCVNIPERIKASLGRNVEINFFVGNTKMYKLQNIRKFIWDYEDKKTIQLGKEFNFYPGESRFDKTSSRILDYLMDIYDVQETCGKGNSTLIFNKSTVFCDLHMLLRFLRLAGKVSLTLFGKDLGEVEFKDQKPDLNFYLNMNEDDDSLVLTWDAERIVPLDENGLLFYHKGALYHPDKNFINQFLPFYSGFDSADNSLTFEGEAKERFMSAVLPRIHDTFNLTIPKSLAQYYIADDATFKLYLDRDKNDIRIELHSIYGEYEFNPFGKLPTGKMIIIRQMEREAEVVEELENYGFVREDRYFYMRDEEDIYNFFTEKLKELSNKYDMFYSDDFKSIKVNAPKLNKTSVHIASDNKLLEVDFDFEDVPKEELASLIESLRLRKKFFRLSDGSFIDLQTEDTDKINGLLAKINADKAPIEEGGSLKTSLDYAFFLESELKDDYYNSELDDAFEKLIDEVENPKSLDLKVPANINAELRDYQKVGFEWLTSLKAHKLGGILADDMGLGKTLQAIVYMTNNRNTDGKKTNLVVCPSSLVYNWADEIENFSPELKSVMIIGQPEVRKELLLKYEDYDVVLCSYPILRRDIEILKTIHFDSVFLDEAQFIKNANSQNSKAARLLNADHRFALTGTPIENNLSELWSIFDFIMPGYLYNHAKFVNIYEKPIMRLDDDQALRQLNFHIKPFIMRRMKKDVLTELPDKIEKKMVSDMTEEQKKVYMAYLSDIKNDINHEIEVNGFEKSRMMILASLTRLRQVCCHPSTFVENYEGGSGKLNLLLDLLRQSIEGGHRILVFSQFTSMLKIIEDELKEEGIEYFYLDGATPLEERRNTVKRFNNGEAKVYLISLKAGGTGLNLTGADMVIHYDPWWNPAVEDQATDRVYRIGQKNVVNVMKLITKGTIEEKIYKLQERKKDLSDSVIQSGEVFINKLTREEIESLFDY